MTKRERWMPFVRKVLVIVVAAAVAVAWSGVNRRALVSGGVLELHPTAASAAGADVHVEADVMDYAQGERSVRAWFLLVKPGGGDPWNRSAYHSSTQERALHASVESFSWDESVDVPEGEYEVWVVMHRLSHRGVWEHAAAAPVMSGTMHVGAGNNGLFRGASPSGESRIASLSRQSDGSVRILVENNEDATVTLAIDDRGSSLKGWRSESFNTAWSAAVEPGSHAVVLHDVDRLVPEGVFRLRFRLYAFSDPVEVYLADDAVPLDDVVEADVREGEADAMFHRYSSPYGPVQVRDAHLEGETMVVELMNTAARAIQVRTRWHVAGVGDLEPWKRAAVSSPIRETELEPGAVRTFRIGLVAAVPEGQWEASVWVHWALGTNDEYRHSDAVWAGTIQRP
jgi:hypothetical protein